MLPTRPLSLKSYMWAVAAPSCLLLVAMLLGLVIWDALGTGYPRLTGGILTRPAAAQQRSPVRWPPGSDIAVWVEKTAAPAGADALVARAIGVWTNAAGGHLRLHLSGPADATIRVHFIPPGSVYGETLPHADPRTGVLVGAEVGITSPAEGDALERQIVIYLTALHELGHALGLVHTDSFADIMYRFRRADDGARYFGVYRARLSSAADIGSPTATGLSAHDVEAIRSLYER
jgi:hypothetical protein